MFDAHEFTRNPAQADLGLWGLDSRLEPRSKHGCLHQVEECGHQERHLQKEPHNPFAFWCYRQAMANTTPKAEVGVSGQRGVMGHSQFLLPLLCLAAQRLNTNQRCPDVGRQSHVQCRLVPQRCMSGHLVATCLLHLALGALLYILPIPCGLVSFYIFKKGCFPPTPTAHKQDAQRKSLICKKGWKWEDGSHTRLSHC